MKNFLQSALGAIVGAALLVGVVGGASVALADRVSTAAGTVSSVGLSSSGGSLTIGGTPVTTTGTLTAVINLAHANAFTALQSFLNASSSLSSHTGTAWFGGSATTTINADGNGSIVIPSAGTLTNTGKTNGCASWSSAALTSTGTACGSVTSVGLTDSNSTLTIGSTPVTTSGTITATFNLAHANAWTGLQSFLNASSTLSSHTGAAYFGGTATTTINGDGVGGIGVGTTSPMYKITGIAGTSAAILEKDLATSTSMTLNPSNGQVQLARIGTAGVTFTGAGFVPGAKIDLTVCNPGSTGGTLTWTGFHTFGTAPTQTTTANQCDKYVVGMTQATSTAATTGVLYYAQAGAGLQ